MMDRIENRILIGITTFVGIMILVGWIAINEGGRMQAFERQFNARSVERGAALFANNCATCHNADARGIIGRAPGLNNPQLFGFNYFADIDNQISSLTQEMMQLETELTTEGTSDERIAEIHVRLGTGSIATELYAEALAAQQQTQDAADAESTAEPTAAGDEAAIPAGPETDVTPVASEATAEPTIEATPTTESTPAPTTEGATAESTEEPSLETQAETAAEVIAVQSPLQQEQTTLTVELAELQDELAAEGVTEERVAEINARLAEINARLGANSIPDQILALNSQRITLAGQMQAVVERGYDPTQPDRLANLGWGGGLETFIYTTLIHGRPVSGQYWPTGEAMPAWSQQAGGPLRNDQLQDLTNYVLNFDKGNNWTLDDLFAVNQFAIVPGAEGGPIENPVGTDVTAILAELETVTGDPLNGQTLYQSFTLACTSCHVAQAGDAAPALEGTFTRIINVRLNQPEFAGYTPEQYIVESIVLPDNFLVPPYNEAMPNDFGTRLDIQMLADLVAYIESQDGPSPE
jgi:mono/diheme cytochrome c family protein